MGRQLQMKGLAEGARFLTDTHPLIWHLSGDSRLSTEARRRFVMAERGEAVIFISAISIAEIIYLSEKKKIPDHLWEYFRKTVRSEPRDSYRIVDITYELIQSISDVPRERVPELPDRIIAATALSWNLPLMTKDHRLQEWEGVMTIW